MFVFQPFPSVRQAHFLCKLSRHLKRMTTQFYYLMSLLLSKTFRTVAQMCHCEAVELFVVLDDTPCFPSHAISFWWVYNPYGHRKSLSQFAVWHSVLAW